MTRVCLAAGLLLSAASWSQAQSEPNQDQPVRPAGQSQERPSRRDRDRNRGQQELRESRLDRMVERASEMYELDDSQKVVVRNEIQSLQAQRRAAMGPEAEEYDQLREKMNKIFESARGANSDKPPDREAWKKMRDDPELRTMRQRMRAIDEKYPFNWDEALKRVELLLPPDQAAKGRAKWENGRSRRDDRSADRFPRFERERGERRRGADRRDRGRQDGPAPVANGKNTPVVPPAPPRPLHPWETYVRKFIEEHKLTDAQAHSAMAILKDMRQRAEPIEKVEAKPPATTQNVVEDIKKRTDAIFEEMKLRLDGLLTEAQRAAEKKP